MSVSKPADVLELLADEREDELVGEDEQQWFDAKGTPYRVEAAYQKWELAKDISAMANSGGGVILVAARTTKPATHLEERVDEVVPVPAALVDLDQYRKVIRDWTWPPLGNRVKLHLFRRAQDRVLLAIEVEALPDDEQPCMVKTIARVGEPPDQRDVEYWAIARRVGTTTEWVPAQQVWSDIRDGRLARRHLTLPPRPSGSPSSENVEDRVAELVTLAQATERACIVLAAAPPMGADDLTRFYALDGVAGHVRHLPEEGIRPSHGFGLGYGLDVSQVSSALVTIEVDRRALLVEPSGLTVALAVGSSEMLGWSQRATNNGIMRVNLFVLVEWVSEFCQFLTRILGGGDALDNWVFIASGLRLQSGNPSVGMPTSMNWLHQAWGQPVADEPRATVAPTGDPERDAYLILREVMGWFGLSDIPFSDDDRISTATIRAWN